MSVELSEELRLAIGDDPLDQLNDCGQGPVKHFGERPHNASASLKKGAKEAELKFTHERQTKRKKKFLAKVTADKEKKERKKKLIAQLGENQLTAAEQSLLRSTSKMGHKPSAREEARDSLFRERVGIPMMIDNDVVEVDQLKNAKQRANQLKRQRKASSSVSTTLVCHRVVSSDDGNSSDDEPSVPAVLSSHSPFEEVSIAISKPSLSESDVVEDDNIRKEPVSRVTTRTPDEEFALHKYVVRVERSKSIIEARSKLPVCLMEQEIMEIIEANPVTVLCGETGSGKTTQVPQFLFEAGFGCAESPNPSRRGMVAVTQPRRVAAVSMAQRVRSELISNKNDPIYNSVGYQIRYDSKTINEGTRIKFMTDGVLLREARDDLLLRRYSVIILDEAHERNLNTDILLGLLSKIVPLRAQIHTDQSMSGIFPLKVVIMSATLRVDDFAKNPRLFVETPPPVIKVDARQFPVTDHFSRTTEMKNFLAAAFNKVCAIHKRLPAGGILVFLTGQREIEWMCQALKSKFTSKRRSANKLIVDDENVDFSDIDSDAEDDFASSSDDEDVPQETGDELAKPVLPASATSRIKKAAKFLNMRQEADFEPLHVLPLFSRLPTKEQMKVFEDVPQGHRLVVVATNVAETSITIPGIRYVVDSGREKRKTHDQHSGTSKFEISWISQASANQRMGRAGRTGPGHCYRLYSSAVFNDQFQPFPDPEIKNLPIEDVILYMKSMGINELESFPFPSPPDLLAVNAAESRLTQLGALIISKDKISSITPLGRKLSSFPVRARLGKMLAIAACDSQISIDRLGLVVALVAALSLQEPFQHRAVMEEGQHSLIEQDTSKTAEQTELENELQEKAKVVNEMWSDKSSDGLGLLRAAGAYAHTLAFGTQKSADLFCEDHFLHCKTMKEQVQLRYQLAALVARMRAGLIHSNLEEPESDMEELEDKDENIELENKQVHTMTTRLRGPLAVMNDKDSAYVCQLIASGYLDQVAVKVSKDEARGLAAQFKFKLTSKWPYKSCNAAIDYPLFIHPHSNCFAKVSKDLPDYVVYGQVTAVERVQNYHGYDDNSDDSSSDENNEMEEPLYFMRQLTKINQSWLFDLAEGTSQCNLSRVLDQPPPTYSHEKDCMLACVHPMYGPRQWKLPYQWVSYPISSSDEIRERTQWFARSLLEGKVLKSFSMLKPWLSIPAAYATRKVHDLRVVSLVQKLSYGRSLEKSKKKKRKSKEHQAIHSRKQLFEWWDVEPHFLFSELNGWIRKEFQNEFKQEWQALTIGEF